MTREEAIEVLKDIYNYTRFDTYTTNEARTMAINALEQEPIDNVLDKIRAEIMQVSNQEKFHDAKWALGLRYAIKIIDKYRKESEDKE